MARYGRIIHSEFQVNYIKFENVAARRSFAEKFENYHAGHDHDGEVPVFEEINTKDVENYEIQRARTWGSKYLTIDGYTAAEIYAYHTWDGWGTAPHYKPPTCCISPLIVLEKEFIGGNGDFVDSGTLERHALSSVFGDMPEGDFQKLLTSVETDGFMDPLIRMYEGRVLDGWHRYSAALKLNIVRKLKFTTWNEEDEGDPRAFVFARNVNRRHLTPGQRAQVAVTFNERFGHGGDRSNVSNDTLKNREQLAKDTGVGAATISRAVAVEKAGRSEEVITGEKTAGEVLTEESIKALWEQITPAISEWKTEREGVGSASKTMFIHAALRYEGHPVDTKTTPDVLKILLGLLTDNPHFLEKLIRKQLDGKSLWAEFEDDEAEDQPVDVEAVQRDIIKAREKADIENGGMVSFRPIANKHGITEAEVSQIASAIAGSTPNTNDREVSKLVKKKKQTCKMMWDQRKEASKVWLGDSDTDLNQYLSLEDLEKGFAENNPAYAEAYASAMRRTSVPRFEAMLDDVLESDVDLDTLEREYRAILTYAGDLRIWERPQWHPDSNWVLPLIEDKQKRAKSKKENVEEADQLQSDLSEQIEKNVRAVRDVYAEVWTKGAASVSEMFTAGITYYNLPKEGLELSLDNPTGGYEDEKTLKRIEGVTAQMVRDYQGRVKAVWIRKLFPKKGSKSSDVEKANALERFANQKSELYKHLNTTPLLQVPDEFGNINTSVALHKVMCAAYKAYELDEALLWSDKAIEALTTEDIRDLTSKYFLILQDFADPRADWVAALYQAVEDEDVVAEGLGGIDIRALRDTLSDLLEKLGVNDVNHNFKGKLCEDLTDVFLQYENPPTTQECAIALLDCADTWLSEYDK